VSWFDKIVDAVRTAAVIGERVERLSGSVANLAVELRDLDRRVARLEGVVAAGAATPPAMLRELERRLSQMEGVVVASDMGPLAPGSLPPPKQG
jgi:hypothetical protein